VATRPIVEVQTAATVTDDAPLTILVDGASTPCPANVLDAGVYEIGQRVTVTVRNPLLPLVQGVES
jgi:hypothetical protein